MPLGLKIERQGKLVLPLDSFVGCQNSQVEPRYERVAAPDARVALTHAEVGCHGACVETTDAFVEPSDAIVGGTDAILGRLSVLRMTRKSSNVCRATLPHVPSRQKRVPRMPMKKRSRGRALDRGKK
jgi:hypothetical protein